MKMVQNIILTLVTVLTFTLSSCNPASVPTVTPDEIPVVATADEAQTEPTTIIEETTAAVTEETTVPETTAPEVTEPTKAQEPEKTENKPVNNNSSDKQQNNTNNNTQNTNKPSNNNGSQTTNKPSNNTSSGSNSSSSSSNKKPAETKPAEQKPVVVTDDTPLTYEEFVNDKNIQRLCDDVNAYFIAKGMIYTPSLNKDNSGWFYGYISQNNKTAVRSYNQQKSRTITCVDEQVEAVLVGLGGVTDLSLGRFNCYYEVTPQGYYDIYFCYG